MHSVAERIRKVFKNTKADVIFLVNTKEQDSNFVYLTGFTSGVFEGTSLIVTRNKLILPVTALEYEIAMQQRPKEMKVVKIDRMDQIYSLMKKYLKSKVVGVNESYIPYRSYQRVKKIAQPKRMINVSDAFAVARSIKDKSELANIKIANRIAKKALEQTKRELKVGMSEREVAGRIDFLMVKYGASKPSFDSIVAFNSNAALPHHSPDGTKLKPNSIVLMDIGAKYNNYCSDITRTFMFKEDKKSEKYRRLIEMHGIVSDAKRIAFEMIKEGMECSKVHEAAADHINKAANGRYKGTFIHSLGHALGLEVHDLGPGLSSMSKEKLKANMVVTDEPGIYIVGFGGVRIEDDVIVNKDGATML